MNDNIHDTFELYWNFPHNFVDHIFILVQIKTSERKRKSTYTSKYESEKGLLVSYGIQ